jgi:glucoamylase
MSVHRAASLSLAALLVTAITGLASAQEGPIDETTNAPGAPGKAATWAAGDKDGFGTSRTSRSKVWYTLNDGALTEVFFPRIDTPATRDTQLVISDGTTFVDREDEDTDHQVQLIRARSRSTGR